MIPTRKCLLLFLLGIAAIARANDLPPVHLAIYGLVHDHARSLIPGLAGRKDVQLVGIVEPDRELAADYAARYHLDPGLFVSSLEELTARTKVDAVATFTSTLDHRKVVELCAPLGINVMVEKPLAVSLADARAIAAAAEKGGIQVVVNYETTWYPSNKVAKDLIRSGSIGEVRKIVAHYGHEGPAKIGCSKYFLGWLTDPVQDGGGALMDFGCYGADLVTGLMEGRRPVSVLAVTQNFQPETYPRVEDEATLVLTYPGAQAIIQASWNWPYGRKDMEIYGQGGTVRVPDRDTVLLRKGRDPEAPVPAPALAGPDADPVSYLVAVVRGRIKPTGLSSVKMNLVVCEILDAARESARTGRRIDLGP